MLVPTSPAPLGSDFTACVKGLAPTVPSLMTVQQLLLSVMAFRKVYHKNDGLSTPFAKKVVFTINRPHNKSEMRFFAGDAFFVGSFCGGGELFEKSSPPPHPLLSKTFIALGINVIVYLCARPINRSRGRFGTTNPKRLFILFCPRKGNDKLGFIGKWQRLKELARRRRFC